MTTIDAKGALHAGDGKYTNKPQASADYDLASPVIPAAKPGPCDRCGHSWADHHEDGPNEPGTACAIAQGGDGCRCGGFVGEDEYSAPEPDPESESSATCERCGASEAFDGIRLGFGAGLLCETCDAELVEEDGVYEEIHRDQMAALLAGEHENAVQDSVAVTTDTQNA